MMLFLRTNTCGGSSIGCYQISDAITEQLNDRQYCVDKQIIMFVVTM